MSRIFPKKKDQEEKRKPSFDDWLKKTNELLNEYMDEPVGEMFGSDKKKTKKASQNIKEKQKKLPKAESKIKKEEGDPAAERRIEESRAKRKKEKLYEENKVKNRRKTLRKALIYSEILGKPVSKRK
ncbi:MAG: hypothetical protein MRZ08_02575 [Anaerococcus sp.]|uniref:hypothetical protein n=1 Tax=Anaerococcus sp. TaxID=1872515 RepID=UPI0026389C58|nr:hypothetical protein [Anaerococcus sp.]MCI5971900.1 hypothetical protein [Anaerococcus sp.]MDD6918380.1 hypothetical protein [Peptoniphilaceae bacterium]